MTAPDHYAQTVHTTLEIEQLLRTTFGPRAADVAVAYYPRPRADGAPNWVACVELPWSAKPHPRDQSGSGGVSGSSMVTTLTAHGDSVLQAAARLLLLVRAYATSHQRDAARAAQPAAEAGAPAASP